MMERENVSSSLLESVGYDPETLTLEIGFKSGRVYQYYQVPPNIHAGLISASSLGEYFNKEIREQYEYTEVDNSQVG